MESHSFIQFYFGKLSIRQALRIDKRTDARDSRPHTTYNRYSGVNRQLRPSVINNVRGEIRALEGHKEGHLMKLRGSRRLLR